MRIAVVQLPGAPLTAWADTLRLIQQQLRAAAARGAELAVLPECAWPAYCLGSAVAYHAARAAGLPAPAEFLNLLSAACRALRIGACVGYVEELGAKLLNAASVIGPDGAVLGTARKSFLWDFDHAYFAAATELDPIDTPWGRLGVLICADARLPEIPATLAARGAQLLVQPTAWVNAGTPAAPWNPQPDFLIAARALEFGLATASASKWGAEGATEFVGSSGIWDRAGARIAACESTGTALALTDVELAAAQAHGAISGDLAGVLLSEAAPAWPPSDVPPLQVMLGAENAAGAAERSPQPATKPASGRALELRLLSPPARTAGAAACVVHGEVAELAGPTPAPIRLGSALLASVPAEAARSFAPLRVHALRGVHAAVVWGDAPQALVQARACENRIFVIWAGPADVRIIDPRGLVRTRSSRSNTGTRACGGPLELKEAACKNVCAGTNLLSGRAVRAYQFQIAGGT